jgi:hypothetical protein
MSPVGLRPPHFFLSQVAIRKDVMNEVNLASFSASLPFPCYIWENWKRKGLPHSPAKVAGSMASGQFK